MIAIFNSTWLSEFIESLREKRRRERRLGELYSLRRSMKALGFVLDDLTDDELEALLDHTYKIAQKLSHAKTERIGSILFESEGAAHRATYERTVK